MFYKWFRVKDDCKLMGNICEFQMILFQRVIELKIRFSYDLIKVRIEKMVFAE